MKRILAACICMLLLGCVTPVQSEQTPQSSAPAATEATMPILTLTPEQDRFPVTEAIAPLPKTLEAIDLEDHLLIYESDGATYLYAYGESILLHHGGIYKTYGAYNYLTEGTALTFIEPGDGTLHIIDLNDPQKTPATINSDAVSGVKRFAISQSGNEILFLKDSTGGIAADQVTAVKRMFTSI